MPYSTIDTISKSFQMDGQVGNIFFLNEALCINWAVLLNNTVIH